MHADVRMRYSVVYVPDVDYISLSCLFEWSYYFSYAMTMLLPAAVMLILAFRHYVLGLGFNQCVQKWLTFVVIVYNGLVTKIFQVFICIPLVDGTSMLKVSPDITVCALLCMYMYACAYMCAGGSAGLVATLLWWQRVVFLYAKKEDGRLIPEDACTLFVFVGTS